MKNTQSYTLEELFAGSHDFELSPAEKLAMRNILVAAMNETMTQLTGVQTPQMVPVEAEFSRV